MRLAMFTAGLPLVTGAALLLLAAPPRAWPTLAAPAVWRITAEALVLDAALLVVLLPVLGVLGATRRIGTFSLAVFVGGFLVVSWGMAVTGFGPSGTTLRLATAAHLTLAAAALALLAGGAACARLWRDPLDAIALGLGLTCLVSFGVLVAGPLADILPPGATTVVLGASPVVAVAAAAEIDLLRTELFYEWSPLAHRRLDYPAWWAASAGYLTVAMLGIAFMRSRAPVDDRHDR